MTDRSSPAAATTNTSAAVAATDTTAQPSRFVVGIDLGTTNCAASFVDTLASDGDWRVETFAIPQWVDWGLVERRTTLPSFHYRPTEEEAASLASGLPWQRHATLPALREGRSLLRGGHPNPTRERGTEPNPTREQGTEHPSPTRERGTRPEIPCDSDPSLTLRATIDDVVGVLARDAGMRRPGRRIASAKSWLSHDAVDRTAEILPWQSDPEVQRLSPVDASARYLAHLRSAWDQQYPEHPLAQQDVVITLPASFDEVARELTVAAARAAGLSRVFLIEEPQAAFYAWINRHRLDWHGRVHAGQMILVCDIGGGTSDFTLIRVRPAGDDGQQVQFHRVAVGRHLILGGDNLDLAVAKAAEAKIMAAEGGQSLSARDWDRLIQAARLAKEAMLSDDRPDSWTVTLPGASSKLIAAGRSVQLTADEIDQVLVDGFFPVVAADARPAQGQSGFRELGLPYASDPAITRHLAEFLATHARSGLDADDTSSATRPDWVLFNGGVMSAPRLRDRLVDNIAQWCGQGDGWRPQVLDAQQLDLAVAHGAAYFGMVRRGQGVRIAANLGRSYFLQVADGPPETICLIPGSAESGQTFAPPQQMQLQLGLPVQFPLWVSSTRLSDQAGDPVTIDPAVLSPLPPIRSVLLRGKQKREDRIAVRMEAELSEIGTLAVYCVEAQSGKRWRLDFDVRSTMHTDREAHSGSGESQGIVDPETLEACQQTVHAAFSRPHQSPSHRSSASPVPSGSGGSGSGGSSSKTPGAAMKSLRGVVGADRSQWPPHLLRGLWQSLLDVAEGRRQSAAHEIAWLNWCGYCLRPGFGMAVDDWRVSEVWRNVHGKLAFAAAGSRTESLILWRRIAGGLTDGQQEQLVAPILTPLVTGSAGKSAGGKSAGKQVKFQAHEIAELWRMVGAMERLPASVKTQLAQAAVAQCWQPPSESYRDALLWAVGRLASRKPIYGPLNKVVSADTAAALVSDLIAGAPPADPNPTRERETGHPNPTRERETGMLYLALMQIAQKTDDRYHDLPESVRQRAAMWLQQRGAPQRFADAILIGGQTGDEDAAAIFGESLPLGIRLAT